MYLLRYTPQAMRDMDSVWDEVYQASKSYDIADKYIKDFYINYICLFDYLFISS